MKVGRIVRVLTDNYRIESFNNTNEKRKVVISVFYPVSSSWTADRKPLYSDLFAPSKERFIKNWVNDGIDENYIKNLATNIYINAPITREERKHPVILYSPGCTCDRDYSTFLIEKLVEEGYIVITIGSLYETEFTVLPDGEIIEMAEKLKKDDYTFEEYSELRDIRKNDLLYVLKQIETLNIEDEFLKGKLDLSKIGAMGFSLGATTVFESAADDNRIKAVTLLEGCLFNSTVEHRVKADQKLNTPLLLLKRHDSTYELMVEKTKQWFDNLEDKEYLEEVKVISSISKTQEKLWEYLNGYKSFVKVLYSNHPTFSDFPILLNQQELEYCGGKINIGKAHNIISEAVVKFFNEFLNGEIDEYKNFINSKSKPDELKVINAHGDVI